ncbi:hypothetical protein GCM10010394_66620 [Streptomyces crystallinus]|uniref:Secreted protein n=1 Tax=Streptomyces crystallinus TaxID=68191 RepID=A0ABN1H1Z8_9ACTN
MLGVVAGLCTGYLVQADRAPTPLPPLSQPALAQAKGKAPAPLSATRDHKAVSDGDLRTLLLKRPAGASEAEQPAGHDGWMSMSEYAEGFTQPGAAFSALVSKEFRRAAVTDWRDGSLGVEIRLIQFRDERAVASQGALDDAQKWANQESGHTAAIPGSGNGRVYTGGDLDSGGHHRAEAFARRGSVLMEMWLDSDEPIAPQKALDLAQRQWERM